MTVSCYNQYLARFKTHTNLGFRRIRSDESRKLFLVGHSVVGTFLREKK